MRQPRYNVRRMLAGMLGELLLFPFRLLLKIKFSYVISGLFGIMLGLLILLLIRQVAATPPPVQVLSPADIHATTMAGGATPAPVERAPTPTIPPGLADQKPVFHATGESGTVELTVYQLPDGSYWWRMLTLDQDISCRVSASCRAFLVVATPFGSGRPPLVLELIKTTPYTAVSAVMGYTPFAGNAVEIRIVEGSGDDFINLTRNKDQRYLLTATH